MMSGNTKESLAETVAELNLDRTKLHRKLAAARADADRLAGALGNLLNCVQYDEDGGWSDYASKAELALKKHDVFPDVPETDCGNMPPEQPSNPRQLEPPAGPETDCATDPPRYSTDGGVLSQSTNNATEHTGSASTWAVNRSCVMAGTF